MDIQIFSHPEFGDVRTAEIDNEVCFVGKDVAIILGYAKPENALLNHVDDEDKTTTLIQGNGSNYKSKIREVKEHDSRRKSKSCERGGKHSEFLARTACADFHRKEVYRGRGKEPNRKQGVILWVKTNAAL